MNARHGIMILPLAGILCRYKEVKEMVAGHLQVKKGYYYMVLSVPDQTGKLKPKWVSTGIKDDGRKSQKQANELLLETRYNYRVPTLYAPEITAMHISSSMLFSDYMLSWLKIIRSSVEEDTFAGYETNVTARIAPYFQQQGVTLGNLTALDVQCFYTYCSDKLKLKGTTVQHFHANIHKALKYAVCHDLITTNPMDKVDRPKGQSFRGAFYTLSEMEHLFSIVRGDPIEFPVLMSAFYGLRRSEVVGLRWQAIDFESNTITIAHTVVQFHTPEGTKTISKDRTKNKSSCRSMPMVPQFRELLLRMKARQEECKRLCGACYQDSDYIYVNDLGKPYTPNYVTQHFKLVLKRHNLREIRFHDLRHSCASLLLKSGAPMKNIQEWLGHSDFSTTANLYAHLETQSKSNSASLMTASLSIQPGISPSV